MRPRLMIAATIATVVGSVAAAGAERPREDTVFMMKETGAYMPGKKVDAKAVREWVKQLRNIALLKDDCELKAMVESFKAEVPSRSFETISDRIDRFKKSYPLISTPDNPKGIYRCIAEIGAPKHDGVRRIGFEYRSYKNALEIQINSVYNSSKPYEISQYVGQNAFGASANVRRMSVDSEDIHFSFSHPDRSKPADEYQYRLDLYKIRLKADRKQAADLESSLYVYAISDLAYPYFSFNKKTDKPTISDPYETTSYNYDVYMRPRFIIVGDFFSSYLKVFDVSKCVEMPSDQGVISEENCR